MKKILFLLVLIYSSSFADMCTKISIIKTAMSDSACRSNLSTYSGTQCVYDEVQGYTYWIHPYGEDVSCPVAGNPLLSPPEPVGKSLCSPNANGDITCVANPDPLQNGARCRDLFQKDGTAYTCNPNTNESTPIPNSNGTIADPEGGDKPNCNDGYSYTNMPNMSANGSTTGYYTHSCTVDTPTPPTGGTGTGGTGEPSISYGGDGSVTMTLPDGTKQTTYGDGWVTTTYPDGSTSSTPPRTGGSGGSSGGSGTSGGGTGGTSGNTTNENNTTPPTDTPIDNTPVANACTDSALTLQERMLCELNAGMKKQNSEGNPSNSLNQLLKDLKASNQTDNTAINTNLKDVVSGTTQLVNKQTQANTTLDKINDSLNSSELNSESMNFGINKISGTLDDIKNSMAVPTDNGQSTLTGLDDYINDDNNFEGEIEATSELTSLLSSKFNQYSGSLKNQLLSLFSTFFSINTSGLPPIGVPYNFNAFGHNFQGSFLDEQMFNDLGLNRLSIIVIFLFSMSGFLNAFKFLINSSSPVKDK